MPPSLRDEEVPGVKQVNAAKPRSSTPAGAAGESFNYSPPPTEYPAAPLPKSGQEQSIESAHVESDEKYVPIRSKPIAIQAVHDRTGSVSYRVLGTIHPKQRQRKQHFACLEDAVATQAAWEAERIGIRAGLRPKITQLNVRELAQAEVAVQLLDGTGLSIVDAARHVFRNPPPTTIPKKVKEALAEFLEERRPFVGDCQYENLRLAGEQFCKFLGAQKFLSDITTSLVMAWLRSKGEIKKKTWNNYRNDLSTLLEWCSVMPRRWIAGNPIAPVPQHEIVRSLPERLEVKRATSLMGFLEAEHPEWCVFFTLALFAGVRPDMSEGEMSKLAAAVKRDGVEKYFCNGVVHITAELAKDKRSRQTKLPENALAWLSKYSVNPGSICPNDWPAYGLIREKFQIPHDGLRHTAISAHVSLHGSFAEAASEFGNSESMIRSHYFNRMSKDEAQSFYNILPSTKTDFETERLPVVGRELL